jgi:hypothetical protein
LFIFRSSPAVALFTVTARGLGKQIRLLNAVNEGEIDAAFVAMARERPDALLLRLSRPLGSAPRKRPTPSQCLICRKAERR